MSQSTIQARVGEPQPCTLTVADRTPAGLIPIGIDTPDGPAVNLRLTGPDAADLIGRLIAALNPELFGES